MRASAIRSVLALLAFTVAVLAIASAGWLRPIDDALRDLRFAVDERAPTGQIVFVDIDARALSEVGVWPWPRRIYGEITDRLMEMGAAEVAFDVDFSVPSNDIDDALFEAALERAGGYAMLAAFQQAYGSGPVAGFNLPLPRFRQHAPPVAVNVEVGSNGIVRSYPHAVALGDGVYPSLATALTPDVAAEEASFLIDFSIDASAVTRVSVADLLTGAVDPALILDRQVVVGASALELRDSFVVPVHGVLPGALVQILAAETLQLGRVLRNVGLLPTLPPLLLLLAAASFALLRNRVALRDIIASAVILAVLVEAVAYALQVGPALAVDTTVLHLTLTGFVVGVVSREVRRVRQLHAQAARDRDATRIILDHVIADNFDGVVVVDERGPIVAASRLAEELLGAGLRGRIASEVLPPRLIDAIRQALGGEPQEAGRGVSNLSLPQAGGDPRDIEYAVTISAIEAEGTHPGRRVACLSFRDITERRRQEERLRYLAGHDPLTGALSRVKLVELIEAEMVSEASRTAGVTVIMVDLKRFKTVNDTLGHSFGDDLLKQVVGRIKASAPEAVARLGGDSFAVLLKGRPGEEALRAFCAELLQRVSAPYQLSGGHQAIVSANAGATDSLLSGNDAEVLLSHADMALAVAGTGPGIRFSMFSQDMDDRLKQRRDMEMALGQALERGEFSLAFQPQVDLKSGELVGVEALVRWKHPTLGIVPPDRFIAAAEESGQIIELGRWVLHEACRVVASWPFTTRLAVNVSPIQFELVDIVSEVRTALAVSGLAAHRLDLEITEGIFLSNSTFVSKTLEQLRQMGIGVALDDFGTGYSSLSYLGRLPVDKIKIDKSFVGVLPANEEAGAIVRAVMTISETLEKVVVAEGIETADQAWMLRMMGCQIGQGYHFARPLDSAALVRWHAERAVAPHSLAG